MAEDISRRDAEALKDLRSQEVNITRELIDLRDKLVTLSRADVINLEEVAKIQAQSLQLEQQRQGVTKQIVSITGEVLETDQKRAEVQERSNKNAEEALKATQDASKIQSEQLKRDKEREITLKRSKDLQRELAESYDKVQKTVKNEKQYADELLKIKGQQADVANLIQFAAQNSTIEGGELLRVTQELVNTSQLVTTNIAERAVAEAAAREGKYTELDISREMRGISRAEVELEFAKAAGNVETAKLLEREISMLQEEVAIKQESNKLNEDLAKKMEKVMKTSEKIKGAIEATPIGGLLDGMSSSIEKLPGGSAITKALGVDQVKESLKKNLGDTMTNVVSGFQQGGMAGMKALGEGAKSFGRALMAGPQVVIIAMVAAVAGLVSLFNGADQAVSDIQKTLGGTKEQAGKTLVAAQGMAQEMGIVGVNTKEVAQGMATVSELMGGLDVATQIKAGNKELGQFVKDATVLSTKFGMSTEEIGNIKALATMTGESMGSLMQKSQGLAKGLMTDKEAMKTLASVPKSVTVAFKGGSEALIKAAQKAKMLGMDLKKVQDIGDGLLDIESSLAKEMEARVITGKQLNLDTARQFALNGDIAGLQDELLNQAGSLEEFQNMNRLQQKSMADAMGMTVEDMTEMLTKAQEYRDIGLDSSKISDLQAKNAKELAEIAANTSNAEQKAYIEKMAKEKEASTMAENLSDIMTKIQEKITALIAPLVEVIHGMFDAGDAAQGITGGIDTVASALTPVFDILSGVGKILWTVIKASFDTILSVVKPIFSALSDIFSSLSSGAETTGGLSAIFDKISSVLGTIFGVVGDVVEIIMTGLISPLKMFYMAIITPIWDAFTGIFDALTKAFEPLMGANETGEETAGIMDTIKKVFEQLQPIIGLVGTLIGGLIVRPIELFATLIKGAIQIFSGDFTGAIDTFGKYIFDFFLGIPKMILESIAGAIDAIFGTNIKGAVTGFFDHVQGIFNDIVEYVMNIGSLILDYLMSPFDLVSTVIDGIVQMFSGDFMGGLETIGGGIKDFIMAPFDLVSGLFDNLMGTIGKITDKVSGALSIFGIGGDEAEGETEKKAEETKKAGSASPQKEASAGAGAPAAETKSAGGDQSGKPAGEAKSQPQMATGAVKGMKSPSVMSDKELEEMGKTREEYEREWFAPIGAAATGGIIKKGGATLVGEQGPEIVSLPQGSVVSNASATQQVGAAMNAMGGGAEGAEATESPELLVLQSMDSKLSAILEPFQKLGEAISGMVGMFSGGIGSLAGGMMGSIGDTIGGLFGSSETESASPIEQSTMTAGSMQSPGAVGGESAGGGSINLSSLESKLDTIANILNSAANQPTIIKVGEKVIEEIRSNLRIKATYTTSTDNTYGRA